MALTGQLDASSIVVFDSEWLVGKTQDSSLMEFFRIVLPTEARIVALGSWTSLLFDAIKTVNDGVFEEGRNPAYDNPPLAGYKLRKAVGTGGETYYGDSILIVNSTQPVEIADSVLSWS